MPRFHKAKLPATTPPSPVGQVQKSTSKSMSRVLPATSTATALSVGSALNDTHDKSSGDTTVQGSDTGWQTAYGAARMAVEIAKESSDAFLPLKAVVGAISVLIKNCDVSMSCSLTKHLTIRLFPVPANVGQCGECEGYGTEGVVAVRDACLSHKRG